MLTAIKQNFWLRLAIFAAIALPLAIATVIPTDYTLTGAYIFGRVLRMSFVPLIGAAIVGWLSYDIRYALVAGGVLAVLCAGMGIG